MQILHYAPYRNNDGSTTQKEATARRLLGRDWLIALQSEETILQIFEDNLDDSFTLFCNLALPNLPHDIDLTLVGPKGVWVFEFFYTDGMYKADGDRWLIFDYRTKRLKRCQPNPLKQATMGAQALGKFLDAQLNALELKAPWVSPAVILLNPKTTTQVADTVTLSILRGDKVYEVIARDLKKFSDSVSPEETAAIVEILKTQATTAEAPRPQKKIFTRREKAYRGMRPQQWLIILPIAIIVLLLVFSVFGYLAYDNRAYLAPLLTNWWLRLRLLLRL